jgi:hypothetical protein
MPAECRHCEPVADSDNCFWMFGIAIATIV